MVVLESVDDAGVAEGASTSAGEGEAKFLLGHREILSRQKFEAKLWLG